MTLQVNMVGEVAEMRVARNAVEQLDGRV
jgi:hypothetical protein